MVEPKLRHIIFRTGFFVLLFTVFLTGLVFGALRADSAFVSYFVDIAIKVKHYAYPNPTFKKSKDRLEQRFGHNIENICSEDNNTAYSFFIAGHTYGTPGDKYNGIYRPFLKKADELNKCKLMTYGFFLGDIVSQSSDREFSIFKNDGRQFNRNIRQYIVPGNHDVGIGRNDFKRESFSQHFNRPYFYFEHEEDLFVVLDTNYHNWNISRDQVEMLKDLKLDKRDYSNIFLFTHQLTWLDQDNDVFSNVRPNSWEGYNNKSNFWSVISPIVSKSNANLYIFSGDVGAFPNGSEFFYEELFGFNLFATGMGGGKSDNFLIVSVDKDRNVNVFLELLN